MSRDVHPGSDSFYHVGGTVPRDAACYVSRQADDDLLTSLLRGDFCYVLTSRQMGKSSLMTRAATRLREAGAHVAVADLTAFGRSLSPEQWYDLLLARIGRELNLEDELEEFWLDHPRLPPLARFTAALTQVALPSRLGRIVLFIDEIDVVRSLSFDTDEFFAAIRELYVRRASEPELARLTFCLLGVASPADLIADPRITPFNIGVRIELRDFTRDEAAPLAAGLGARGHEILGRVMHWTHGHPYLTQRLCREMQSSANPTAAGVDAACNRLFFDQRSSETEDNLRFVADRLLKGGADPETVLELHSRLAAGKQVADDETDPAVSALLLSGLARRSERGLAMRNRIYSRVFDRAWIQRHRDPADIRRQREAERRGRHRALTLSSVVVMLIMALLMLALWQSDRAQRSASENADLAEQRLDAVKQFERQKSVAEAAQADATRRLSESLQARRQVRLALLKEQKARASEREARRLADLRTSEAKSEAERADLESYAATINLVQREVTSESLGRADELLESIPDSRRHGWEWGYWHAQRHPEELTLRGHSGSVPSAAWSPDGSRIVTAGWDGTARIWNPVSGREVRRLTGHSEPVNFAAWSHRGSRIVTASWDGTARIWDGVSGKELHSLNGHSETVNSAEWSPDDTRVITAGDDGTARIWDPRTGKEVLSLKGHLKGLNSATWSPDGSQVLTTSWDKTARIWDALSGKEQLCYRSHSDGVNSGEWSHDGSRVVTTSYDKTARIWDASNGNDLITLTGHSEPIHCARWSSDGARIATGSSDKTARIWDSQSGAELLSLKGHSDRVTSIDWSADGCHLVTAGGNTEPRVWDVRPGSGRVILRGHTEAINHAEWSPDGSRIATASDDHTVRIWDATAGREILVLGGHSDTINFVAWSPKGTRIASASDDRTVRIWDPASGQTLCVLKGMRDRVTSLAWSPKDLRVVTTGGKSAHIWDPTSGKALRSFHGKANWINTAAWSPDGFRIVTASGDNSAVIWDANSGRELLQLKGHSNITSAVWSPDSSRILTTSFDNVVRIWDSHSGKELRPLKGHSDTVNSAAWSPNGSRIVTASYDRTARLWDPNSGRELLSLSGHGSWVSSAGWSPDGSRVVTASRDKTARIWVSNPRAGMPKDLGKSVTRVEKSVR